MKINNMWIVNHKKIFYTISIILVILSIGFIFNFGLKPSIDFTGGSILEFEYVDDVRNIESVRSALDSLSLESYVIRASGEAGYILKLATITDAQKISIEEAVSGEEYPVEITRFNTIGPTLGNELKTKASIAILIVIIAIVLFIAFAFRHVSKPVSSWKYGFVAIIALVHDVTITLGVFALFGKLFGVEIDTLFITALLVILGYSINDTIVVLDRVRENLKDKSDQLRQARFPEIVGQSLSETFARSINTSFTTLLSLIALVIVGAASTYWFALALIVGIVAGTYSSIFIAAPLLVSFKNRQDKQDKKGN